MRFAIPFALAFLLSASLSAHGDFSDSFDGDDGPPDGWVNTKGTIPATIEANELIVASDGTNEAWVWIDTGPFGPDFTLELDIFFEPSGASPDIGRHGGVMFAASEKSDRYAATMNGYVMDWIDRTSDHGYRFHKWTAGAEVPLIPDGSFPDTVDPGKTWRITVSGPSIFYEVDGDIVGTVDDPDYRNGYIGFWGWSNLQRIHLDNVKVTLPVKVKLTATPPSGPAPLTVSFDGSGSTTPTGTIASYDWDFGDGEMGSGATLQHTYASPGLYAAKLTVTNSLGAVTACTTESPILVSCATNDVSPWQSKDIGTPVFPGGAHKDANCISVCAGGKEIGRMEDSFHFVYQESAAKEITTQLKEAVVWQTGLTSSKAGLMFRSSLDANSPFAMMAVQPTTTGTKTVFLSRKNSTSNVATRTAGAALIDPPGSYLKLERDGAVFTGSYSTDGTGWTVYHTVTLDTAPDTMFVGAALTAADSRDKGLYADVVFCDLTLGVSEPPPNAPQNLAATAGDGTASLTWDEPAGGGPFTGYRILQNGATLADLPATPRTYNDTGLTNGSRYCYKVLATRADATSAESNESCAIPGVQAAAFHRGDADDNGKLELTDAVRILGFLYLGKPAPADPGPPPAACGVDPTPGDGGTDLGCESYKNC